MLERRFPSSAQMPARIPYEISIQQRDTLASLYKNPEGDTCCPCSAVIGNSLGWCSVCGNYPFIDCFRGDRAFFKKFVLKIRKARVLCPRKVAAGSKYAEGFNDLGLPRLTAHEIKVGRINMRHLKEKMQIHRDALRGRRFRGQQGHSVLKRPVMKPSVTERPLMKRPSKRGG